MSGEVLPAGYGDLLEQVRSEVRTSRVRATRAANTELVGLFWRLGRLIQDRQQTDGWGSKVIERLAADLRAEFSGMRGLSRRNLLYMRRLAVAAAEQGWSRAVLTHQITSGLRERTGAAPSNVEDRLPAVDSDLAQQMLRAPVRVRLPRPGRALR